jgi:hypothetical protein
VNISRFTGGPISKLAPSAGPSYKEAVRDDYQRCAQSLDKCDQKLHANHKINSLVGQLDTCTMTLACLGVAASMATASRDAALSQVLNAGLIGVGAVVCIDLAARALLKASPKLLAALPDSNMPLDWVDRGRLDKLSWDQQALARNFREHSKCAPFYEVTAQVEPETLVTGSRVLTGPGGTLVERIGEEWKVVSADSPRQVPASEFMERFGLWGGNFWGRKNPNQIKDSQVLPMAEAMGESDLHLTYLARCGYNNVERKDNFRMKPLEASLRIENGQGQIVSRWQSQSVKFFTCEKPKQHYALGDLQNTYTSGVCKPLWDLPN